MPREQPPRTAAVLTVLWQQLYAVSRQSLADPIPDVAADVSMPELVGDMEFTADF